MPSPHLQGGSNPQAHDLKESSIDSGTLNGLDTSMFLATSGTTSEPTGYKAYSGGLNSYMTANHLGPLDGPMTYFSVHQYPQQQRDAKTQMSFESHDIVDWSEDPPEELYVVQRKEPATVTHMSDIHAKPDYSHTGSVPSGEPSDPRATAPLLSPFDDSNLRSTADRLKMFVDPNNIDMAGSINTSYEYSGHHHVQQANHLYESNPNMYNETVENNVDDAHVAPANNLYTLEQDHSMPMGTNVHSYEGNNTYQSMNGMQLSGRAQPFMFSDANVYDIAGSKSAAALMNDTYHSGEQHANNDMTDGFYPSGNYNANPRYMNHWNQGSSYVSGQDQSSTFTDPNMYAPSQQNSYIPTGGMYPSEQGLDMPNAQNINYSDGQPGYTAFPTAVYAGQQAEPSALSEQTGLGYSASGTLDYPPNRPGSRRSVGSIELDCNAPPFIPGVHDFNTGPLCTAQQEVVLTINTRDFSASATNDIITALVYGHGTLSVKLNILTGARLQEIHRIVGWVQMVIGPRIVDLVHLQVCIIRHGENVDGRFQLLGLDFHHFEPLITFIKDLIQAVPYYCSLSWAASLNEQKALRKMFFTKADQWEAAQLRLLGDAAWRTYSEAVSFNVLRQMAQDIGGKVRQGERVVCFPTTSTAPQAPSEAVANIPFAEAQFGVEDHQGYGGDGQDDGPADKKKKKKRHLNRKGKKGGNRGRRGFVQSEQAI